ncbi:MAG: PD-(D/E)XK nuclease family protein, partial [Merismopedia sp. SIO2A8]|nr:PD-(D/E)XK nuclease family protein [Merismopedia sp. SIO2A8]
MSHSINSFPFTRLSQGHLNLLENCPRKFQHIYFDQLGVPISYEQQERLSWGSHFHLLMQQRELGLPVESLVEGEQQLHQWLSALINAAPEVLNRDTQTFRESEHCRTLNFHGYLLTVVYDLLIGTNSCAQILDWKTFPQPKNRQPLATDWQTRLYLYVLTETSDYLPEQISMTYWFVKSQPRPQSLKFSYSRIQHQKNREDLTELFGQLSCWQQRYQDDPIGFPQIAASTGRCQNCSFAVRCQRTPESVV